MVAPCLSGCGFGEPYDVQEVRHRNAAGDVDHIDFWYKIDVHADKCFDVVEDLYYCQFRVTTTVIGPSGAVLLIPTGELRTLEANECPDPDTETTLQVGFGFDMIPAKSDLYCDAIDYVASFTDKQCWGAG